MKVERIDHIHISVKNLEEAVKFFSDILDTKFVGPIEIPGEDTITAFDRRGMEIMQSTSPEGWVAKTIANRGEGVLAIGFKVPNIEEAIEELKAKGLRHVGGGQVGNIKAALFHPKDSYGMMIELVEYEELQGAAVANLGRLGNLPWLE